jgi:hypothetical protein
MHGRWAYQHCVVSLRAKEEIKMRKEGRGGGGGGGDNGLAGQFYRQIR